MSFSVPVPMHLFICVSLSHTFGHKPVFTANVLS